MTAPFVCCASLNDVRYKGSNALLRFSERRALAPLCLADRNFIGRAPQYLEANGVYGGCLQTRRPSYCYLRPIAANDPDFVHRPWGPGIADRYTGMRNGYKLDHARVSPLNDHRLAYHNPNLPFIVMAHRFKIAFHHPAAADTAHFRFPPGTPPGMYVIYYRWGGYRDCVDVDVLPDHKPVPQTLHGIYGYRANLPDEYTRTDHCQYVLPLAGNHHPTIPPSHILIWQVSMEAPTHA